MIDLIMSRLDGSYKGGAKNAKLSRENALIKYYECPNFCKFCSNKILIPEDRKVSEIRKKKFCNHSCAASFNNKSDRRYENQHTIKLHKKICKNCNLKKVPTVTSEYCSSKCFHDFQWMKKKELIKENPNDFSSRNLKKLLLEEKGHQCEICTLSKWMEKDIEIELDHIDGNHRNNHFDNLRLICPNCHAQTPTYKGRNRGNGRAYRKKRYEEGKSW